MEQVDANLNLNSQEVVWSWTRPLFQRCKATINGYVRCKHIFEIFAKLREYNRIEEFGRSCFGHFLDFDWSGFSCNAGLHDLVGQGITKTDSSTDELWFRIGNKNIRFSKYEFALVTGLRFGDSTFDPDLDHTPLADGVYARYIGGNITVGRLRVRFLRGDFDEFPGDALKVAIVLFVYYALICKDGSRMYVDNWIWALVEDTDRWESFPWGKYSFQILLQRFRCLPETIRDAGKGQGLPKYHFYGPSYALMVWMYEAVPMIGSVCGRREWQDRVPRCTRWRFKKTTFDMSTFLSDRDHKIDCVERLDPSPIERMQRYWRHLDDDLRIGVQYLYRETRSKKLDDAALIPRKIGTNVPPLRTVQVPRRKCNVVDDVGAPPRKQRKIGSISATAIAGRIGDDRQEKHQSTIPAVVEPRYPRRRPDIGAPIDPAGGSCWDHLSDIQTPVSSHCPDTEACSVPPATCCQDQPPDSNVRTAPSTTQCEERPSVWTDTSAIEKLRDTICEEVTLVFESVFFPKVQTKFSDIVRKELTDLFPHLLVHHPIAGTTSFAPGPNTTTDTAMHAPPPSTFGPDGSILPSLTQPKREDITASSNSTSLEIDGAGRVDYAKAYGRYKDDAANISSTCSQQISKTKDMSIQDRLRSIRDVDGHPQHNLAVTLIDGLPQSIPIPAVSARLQERVPSSSLHETPATEEPTAFEVSDGDTYAQHIHGLATDPDRRALAGTNYVEKFKLLSTYLAQATGVLSDVISDLRVSHSKGELEALRNELHATLIREKQLSLSINKLTEEAEVARATHESLTNKIRALEAGNKKAEEQLALVATRCSEAWQEGINEGLKKFPCTEQGQAHRRQIWEEEKAKFLKSSEFLDHIQDVAFQYLYYGFDVAAYQAQEIGFTGLFDKNAAIDNAPELEGWDPSPSA